MKRGKPFGLEIENMFPSDKKIVIFLINTFQILDRCRKMEIFIQENKFHGIGTYFISIKQIINLG
ncbi:unnamed protein product [Paramecium sonneborni]|nr:unnamed protein product [Paramecium sonneborni]